MIKKILFGDPIIFKKDGEPVSRYSNTFNGTFSNGKPISVMINGPAGNPENVIYDNSCHYIWSKPESVLWIKNDGTHGVSRVQTYRQIPGWQNIVKAIGGVGISNYDPVEEGFCKFTAINIFNKRTETKDFSDVLRRTNHSVFGFKDDVFFAAIMYGTSLEIKAECEELGYTDVVQGDGGDKWAACNTDDVKIQADWNQYSMVQMTNLVEVEPVDKPVDKVDKKWRYFKYSEFANSMDGGANKTVDELIDKLDEFRHLIARSITVTSGYRTPEFNKSVHGDPNSEHIYGLAADIRFNFSSYNKETLSRILKYLGFTNIGFYWDGNRLDRLHVGIRSNSNFKVKIMDWKATGEFIGKTYI